MTTVFFQKMITFKTIFHHRETAFQKRPSEAEGQAACSWLCCPLAWLSGDPLEPSEAGESNQSEAFLCQD